ncbi:MAG: TolC family protein [Acidobacteriia bacterium]|nr:TolC family protein [Terriglobia bacterium]
MNYLRFAVALVVLALPRWTAASGNQVPPVPDHAREQDTLAPTVDELVAAALDRSPSIAALRERLAAAREMIGPAGALPDPMVDFALTDMGFPKYTVGTQEMSMIGPEVRQGFPFPGKREARRQAARAETQIRAAELERLKRLVAAQVRTIYARVYALDREDEALQAGQELLEMLGATVAARYGAGQAEQEAVIKVQLELSRVDERLDDLTAERKALVAGLNRLRDLPGEDALGRVVLLPPVSVPTPSLEGKVLAESPEVVVKEATVSAAARRVEVARLELKPNLSAGAALGLRGSFDPAVTLSFGLELPLWRKEKQEPMIRAADHELAMARADLRDAQAAVSAEAARLAAEWQRSERQVQRYRQAIVPQTSAAIDAARASYLAGRGDFLTVVDDFGRWLDARVQLAAREADRFAIWADVQALVASPTASQAGKEK